MPVKSIFQLHAFALLGIIISITGLHAQQTDRPLLEKVKERIQENRATFRRTSNIQYATHENSSPKRNQLDIYTPKTTTKPTPVVIFVHGGGWTYGDKIGINEKHRWLTKLGIACISTNYRFHPEVDFKAQAQDVADAVGWVKENAKQHNIDPKQIFLMGHSAGAHLVALVGTDATYLAAHKIKPSDLKGVIPIDGGGLDIPFQIELGKSERNVNTYKKVFSEDRATQEKASPTYHLTKRNKFPPFFVAYVTSRITTPQQAKRFVKKLNQVGGKGVAFGADGKTHMTINRELGTENDATTIQVTKFIQAKSAR